jgi:outer membrane lipoprotein-sorting protein/peroxiredoxin
MLTVQRTQNVLAIFCVVVAVRGVQGDDPFEGYSPQARALLRRMSETIEKLRSYSDEGEVRIASDMQQMPEQKSACSFVYERPDHFRDSNGPQVIICDGKELIVYAANMRRYRVAPAKDEPRKELARHSGPRWVPLTNAQLILSENPEEELARHFRKLQVDGAESIDDERCAVLRGMTGWGAPPGSTNEVPVTLWVRSDGLIRRIELDPSKLIPEQEPKSGPRMPKYRYIYDVKNLRVNERPDAEAFVFKPPAGAKQVTNLYLPNAPPSEVVEQFPLSGKPAPALGLETLNGQRLDLADLRGRVVVLRFIRAFGSNVFGLSELQKLQERFDGDEVAVVAVCGGKPDRGALRAPLAADGFTIPVLLDDSGAVLERYGLPHGGATVLIASNGTVQGRCGGLTPAALDAVAAAVDSLRAGEQLESATPMSPEELREFEYQQDAAYSGGVASAEPLHEDWLVERWSARTSGSEGFVFGGVQTGGRHGMWVQDRKTLRQVDAEGKITAEIKLAGIRLDEFSQSAFAVGRTSRGFVAVYMMSIPGERQQYGWSPPKGAILTAFDAEGSELWSMEVEASEHQQLPQNLSFGDLEGRHSNELVFMHQQTVYVVDQRGQIAVRKPVGGWAQWLLVEDRDRDGRDEIYVRTQTKLTRLDYRAGR